jgi:ribosomal protein S18 acetylase RimI-like enzyme|tara:strand:+ start:1671 stop:2153 length:483 start_codon:yes stop_codon:yes gene_type:complete
MQIRTATRSDADAVWHLLQPVFRAGDTYAVDPEISKDSALSYWMDDPAACYVAVDAGQIIGTYYIKTNQQGGGAHVCNCGYVAGVQGQGVATAMCAASQTQARALGYNAMQFNFVLTSNADAIRLWHKLGFDTVGTLPNAFDHPALGMVDAQVMYKWLAD